MFVFFGGRKILGIELRALHKLGKHSTTKPCSSVKQFSRADIRDNKSQVGIKKAAIESAAALPEDLEVETDFRDTAISHR